MKLILVLEMFNKLQVYVIIHADGDFLSTVISRDQWNSSLKATFSN